MLGKGGCGTSSRPRWEEARCAGDRHPRYRDGTIATGLEGGISAFRQGLSKSTASQVPVTNVRGIVSPEL